MCTVQKVNWEAKADVAVFLLLFVFMYLISVTDMKTTKTACNQEQKRALEKSLTSSFNIALSIFLLNPSLVWKEITRKGDMKSRLHDNGNWRNRCRIYQKVHFCTGILDNHPNRDHNVRTEDSESLWRDIKAYVFQTTQPTLSL